jgi:uncharacterized protein YndB with AHSA1/START domain
MPDIFHYFPINAAVEKVFEAISTPKGLDIWWCKETVGKPTTGEMYQLYFGDEYHWQAVVSRCIPNYEFELTMTKSDEDWMNSKVGFSLAGKKEITDIQFYHTGWKEDNDHFRISNYCWAMYLRILKRNLEFGEEVAYDDRLNV